MKKHHRSYADGLYSLTPLIFTLKGVNTNIVNEMRMRRGKGKLEPSSLRRVSQRKDHLYCLRSCAPGKGQVVWSSQGILSLPCHSVHASVMSDSL